MSLDNYIFALLAEINNGVKMSNEDEKMNELNIKFEYPLFVEFEVELDGVKTKFTISRE